MFFPAATHLERPALITTGGGRVQYRPASVAPPGETTGDTELIFELVRRLGLDEDFWDGNVEASFDERLEGSGLRFVDLPKNGSHRELEVRPLRQRMYLENGFGTPTGKIEFVSTALESAGYDGLPVFKEPAWSPVSAAKIAKDYPLILTSGGRSRNYTHSQGRLLTVLREREPGPRLQIHPEDAGARGIHDGRRVEISSPLGAIEMRAHVTDILSPGVVHAPHGWAGHNINELIPSDCLDPISGFPPFKSSLCQVRRIDE